MQGMRNVLRGVTTFALFIVGLSLFLALGQREHWVEPAYIGLVIAAMFVGSSIKLWRAVRYGDFSVKGQWFWLPRSWRAWMHGSLDEKKRARR